MRTAKAKRFVALTAALIIVAGAWGMVFAEDMKKININTATADELTQLRGVGSKTAENIVAHREQNGFFRSPESLVDVKGVGQKTFERNKDFICVEEESKGQAKSQ